jgi:hypothetical protein
MTFLSRAAATAALTLALTGPALAADASGNHWKTLSTIAGGKIQACKVATTDTGPWKVKLRVDASHATGRVQGSAFVTKDGAPNTQKWKSGWVAKGHVSRIGSVRLKRGKSFELNAGIGTSAMGNGGSFKAGAIRGC